MLSRIFWIGLAGLALVIGIALQDGGRILSWTGQDDITVGTEKAIEDSIDRALDGSFDGMQVVGTDGRQIDVRPETKRALADAISRMVEAQADLAILRIRDASEGQVQAATARRDRARADIDRLKTEIHGQEQAAQAERAAVSEQVARDVREEVRATVREAVQN